MRKVRFVVEKTVIGGCIDAARPEPDEPLGDALARGVMESLATEIEVGVGGTTMFLAAWVDPDHWSDDWAEKLGVPYDEVEEAVQAILEAAVEGGEAAAG